MTDGLVRTILRLEGVALAGAAIVLYAHLDGSWLLFALLWLVPDISALGYLLGPRAGAATYNAAHFEALPIALGLVGVLGDHTFAVRLALIWLSHVGIDRALGFGLKLPSGFKVTHLGRMR